jgi:predicted nucleic acid-binding protein
VALTQSEIARYIQALQDFGECVLPGGLNVVAADPADNPVLATAVAGKADVLCTLDRRFAAAEVRDFARAHEIELMNDAELLRRLRARNEGIQ